MPYKNESEKLLIPVSLKRNTKLTDEQRQEIRELYDSGSWSHRTLAKSFGVEKSTIAFILNPERAKANAERNKANRHKYYSKEKQKVYMKRTREYRQELYLDNKLEQNNK